MESVEQIVPCSNCNKPFPSDRIDLHEAYCIRNIKKCNKCDAFVDIHDLQSHQEEFHQKKPCTFCKSQFLPEEMTIHLTQCPRRPKLCAYCETNIAAIELQTHEAVCGARTRICTTCQQPIILKDFLVHEVRCRQHPPQPMQRPVISHVDPVNNHQRNNQRRIYGNDRDRDVSGNNIRHTRGGGGQRSLSNKQEHNIRKVKEGKVKYHCVISCEASKPMVQILPISIQLALNNSKRENRYPLVSKNSIF